MRLTICHHVHIEGNLNVTNAVLSSELSTLESVIDDKNSTISSLSTALDNADAGDSTAISTAVSTAVDAEDMEIASEISSILG